MNGISLKHTLTLTDRSILAVTAVIVVSFDDTMVTLQSVTGF
jgi:hypothetical protein